MIKKSAIIVLAIFFIFLACSDDDNSVGEVDGILPAPISDLQISDTIATALQLRWTAPGDDSIFGRATSYDIRIASSAAYLIYYWSDAIIVPNAPMPAAAGEPESLWVESLSFYFKYYFAIRAKDEAGNIAYISNIVSARPFADSIVIFADNNLDAVVREHLDKDPDSTLWYSEVLSLDTLNGSGRNIGSIDDLHYAANITRLEMANNQISSVTVMPRLNALDTLNLSNNQIVNLDSLSELTGLSYLYLDRNLIYDIEPLADMTGLAYLDLDSNSITSIAPLYDNSGLGSGDYVSLRGNPFTDSTYIDSLEENGVTVIY